jgi:ABC-type transport system involved in cytochrome bd biosynthesis fused ATPase/permease subunit
VLERVTVTTAEGGRRPLDDLSLEIAPGEATAVVGPSGAGKSTLLRVLLGLQPVGSGSVRCGRLEVGDMDLDAWRRGIAWMPQRPVLLPATLAENLRLADDDADEESLWTALCTAGLGAWAAGLPGGLAARLGEGGVAVSAGERRRLALARIALRDPALVLVDEPTANLDALTAALVCDALERVIAGRTAVLVTHDPAVAALAARAVALDAGREAAVLA